MSAVSEKASRIRVAAFDVDGVLTDGRLFLSDSGEEIKAFHTLDGHGLKMLAASGVVIAIITGRRSRLVELRAANLGITHLYQGVEDKRVAFADLVGRLGLQPEQASYMGDDVVDLPVMRRCGLGISVPDAPLVVRTHADLVTSRPGGGGAVREACEFIMQAQGTLDTMLAPYLE